MTNFESKNIRVQKNIVITTNKKSGTRAFKIIQDNALDLFSDEVDILRYLKNYGADTDCVLFEEITHDITGYHKFVKFEDLTDEIIDQNFKSYSCKEDIRKKVNASQEIFNKLTFAIYEEIEGVQIFENHPELLTVDAKNDIPRISTVREFFVNLDFDQESVDAIMTEIKER